MQSALDGNRAFLEERLRTFQALSASRGRTKREFLRSSFHIAEMAWVYYRKSYDLEKEIRNT